MINRSLLILIIAIGILSSLRATAQFSMPDNTLIGTQKQYWVDSVAGSGSTYIWKIDNVIQQSGSVDRISIVWTKVGKFFLEVQEISAAKCEGEVKSGWINVTEVPIMEMICPHVNVACAVVTVPELHNLDSYLLAGGIINHSCALDSASFRKSSEVITGSGYPESYKITRGYSISDYCGNTANCTIEISVPSLLRVLAEPTQLTCDVNSKGKIDVTTLGGTPPYTFAWNKGETSEDISGLTIGIYSVNVTDMNGCTQTTSTPITAAEVWPIASFIPNREEFMTYSFENTSLDAVTYAWNFGDYQTSTLANPLNRYSDIGTYLVTLAVSNNCGTNTATKEITVTLPDLEFYDGFSPNGDGINDFWNIPVLSYYPINNVKIINRWGSKVWQTVNYSNTDNFWSGKNANGNDLPDGTYYYTIIYGKVEKRGWVFIKR